MRKRWMAVLFTIALLSGLGSRPAPPTPAREPAPAELPALPDSPAALLTLARGGDRRALDALQSRPAEALAAIRERLCAFDYDTRIEQVLLTLAQEHVRSLLTEFLETGSCIIPPQALAQSFTQDELKALALRAPSLTSHVAFEAVQERDRAFLEAFIARPENQWFHVLRHDVGLDVAAEFYSLLTRTGKMIVIQQGGVDAEALLERETDPGLRQELLWHLGRVDELMAILDQQGGFPDNSFWQDSAWEKRMHDTHPDSYIARGVRAYEAVLGQGTYFSEERRWTLRGRFPIYDGNNRGYDPDREIPAWLAFLEQFSGHSAGGEAAYRLARCYEIDGRYTEALFWLHRATQLPNGEFASAARGRITWILDALLTDEALFALTDFPPELTAQVEYARALRRLRAGDWDRAVDGLDAVIDRYGSELLGETQWTIPQRLGALLAPQRQQAARLQGLARAGDPESLYALGATMFHDRQLFTNHMWAFGRGPGFIGGHAWPAMAGDYEAQYGRWAADSSNMVQAARVFVRITSGPEELQAKAAYSRARALAELIHPGSYINLWRSQRAIGFEAADLFEAMAERFPASDLADDALLSVAYLRRDPAYFDRILALYPDSDMAADAALHSFEGAYGLPLEVPPYRDLRLAEAPADVAAWVEAHRETNFAGTLAAGEYTYVLATAAPGEAVELGLAPAENSAVQVHVRRWEARNGDQFPLRFQLGFQHPFRLVRFAGPVTVEIAP
ncbi:MAG TPA: hypothetical protein VK464_15100 [Symbiobacteriaceae bacterium]|nr:hypothetical protein [Symbiobacteriaceae bacterium]